MPDVSCQSLAHRSRWKEFHSCFLVVPRPSCPLFTFFVLRPYLAQQDRTHFSMPPSTLPQPLWKITHKSTGKKKLLCYPVSDTTPFSKFALLLMIMLFKQNGVCLHSQIRKTLRRQARCLIKDKTQCYISYESRCEQQIWSKSASKRIPLGILDLYSLYYT